MPKRRLGATLAVAGVLFLALPAQGTGQEGSVRAVATVLAPASIPEVRVVAEVEGGVQRRVVLVTGDRSWGIMVQVAGDDRVVTGRAAGPWRGALPAARSKAHPSERAGELPIRVVLAVN